MSALSLPVLRRLFLPLASAFALFFVLYVYKAYHIQTGLSASGHSLLFRAICFGGATGLNFAFGAFLERKWLGQGRLGARLLWKVGEIWMGANLTFLLFNHFWLWQEWFLGAYLLLLAEYTAVMVFPIVWDFMLQFHYTAKSPKPSILQFFSDNAKQVLSLAGENFLFIESADNYVEIHYLSGGQLKRSLLRTTLKRMEEANRQSPFIQRCHRRYLVNPFQIQNLSYENRNLILDLGYHVFIPVSSSYQASFLPKPVTEHSPLRE